MVVEAKQNIIPQDQLNREFGNDGWKLITIVPKIADTA